MRRFEREEIMLLILACIAALFLQLSHGYPGILDLSAEKSDTIPG
jgi:hypothetical protein